MVDRREVVGVDPVVGAHERLVRDPDRRIRRVHAGDRVACVHGVADLGSRVHDLRRPVGRDVLRGGDVAREVRLPGSTRVTAAHDHQRLDLLRHEFWPCKGADRVGRGVEQVREIFLVADRDDHDAAVRLRGQRPAEDVYGRVGCWGRRGRKLRARTDEVHCVGRRPIVRHVRADRHARRVVELRDRRHALPRVRGHRGPAGPRVHADRDDCRLAFDLQPEGGRERADVVGVAEHVGVDDDRHPPARACVGREGEVGGGREVACGVARLDVVVICRVGY